MARYHDAPTRAAAKKAENSQKYSLYQPVYSKSNRKPSVSKYGGKAKQDRELAALQGILDPQTGRRRATTRSKEHDDEEEQFRKAIEESRLESRPGKGRNGNGKQNGKRGRENDEEYVTTAIRQNDVLTKHDRLKYALKRQRKASDSALLSAKPALGDDE